MCKDTGARSGLRRKSLSKRTVYVGQPQAPLLSSPEVTTPAFSPWHLWWPDLDMFSVPFLDYMLNQ